MRGRGGRERLVVVVGAACAIAGSEHGVVGGAGNDIKAEGAVALSAALQGNTTLRTLDFSGMWTARTRVFCGNGGAAPGDLAMSARAWRRERLVVVVGAACVSVGSEHGVVRGADNGIEVKGAVALAAVLKGNTTLQTLDLGGMSTARTRAFSGNERPLPGHLASARAGRARAAGGWWSARRARLRAVSTAWCVVQTTASKPRAPLRWRRC